MAIFSLNHRPVGRSTHAPGTACAHARYITRESAMSELIGRVPDGYEMNRTGVMNWLHDGELADRSNARVCDKFIVALPLELSPDERSELLRDFIREIGAENVGWTAAIHAKGEDEQNPHAHVIVRDRDLDTGKRVLGTSEKDSTQRIRVTWAEVTNRALERAGVEARIDHRSHAERGIEELPGIHLGPAAHMEARGIPTERGEHLRDIKAANHELREAYSAVREAEQIVRQAAEREPKRIEFKAFSTEIDAAEKELRATFNAGREAREGMREPEAVVRHETGIVRDIRTEAEHDMREQLRTKNAGWFGLWRTSEQRAADTEAKKNVTFTREKEQKTKVFYERPEVIERLQRDYNERKTLVQQGDAAVNKLMRISDARSSLGKILENCRFVGLNSLPEPQAKDTVQRIHEFESTAKQELTRDDRAQQLQQRALEREEQRRIQQVIMRDHGPSISR
jgi:MobA/MobL family